MDGLVSVSVKLGRLHLHYRTSSGTDEEIDRIGSNGIEGYRIHAWMWVDVIRVVAHVSADGWVS